MAQPGITEVGKYRIVEQVGEGAMGVVYRAVDPVLNRTVAIKVMSDALARDDELRGRFLREAQAAGSLQHPNVITIFDFGEMDGHPYIAMEFVAGKDLEILLHEHTALSLVRKVDILIDVLNGLSYAHKRGIVHRDIKPANIRIDEEGRARVMDFGIAHLTASTKMTRTGLMVGTPAYMAPEQINGGAVVPASDLFSVGAVMYELFTGKKPFQGESLQSIMYQIVTKTPPDIRIASPDVPAPLNTIVQRALAKDPSDRYQSAADMANALTEIRAKLSMSNESKSLSLRSSIDTGLAARPRPQTVSRPIRRSVLIGSGIGIVGIAVAIGVAVGRGRGSSSSPPGLGLPAPANAQSAPATPAVSTPALATQASVPVVAPRITPPAPTQQKVVAKSGAKPETAGPTAEELELFRSLQTSAAESRRRAADAGATAEQLLAGDEHNKLATTFAQQGKVTEGASHLNLAAAAWSAAERDARTAAAAAAKPRVVAPDPAPKQEAAVAPPPVVQSAPASPPPAARPPATNAPAEIGAVVAAYARAIESRNVAEVKRAYPAVTPTQADGFGQFFGSVRSLKATLSVTSLDVSGSTAEAHLVGAYDYVTTAGKTERTPLSIQASFRHDTSGWKLTSVR